jgi:hypothetical protein
MSRTGNIAGDIIDLRVFFHAGATAITPDSIQDVLIKDGLGNTLATITPTVVGAGIYEVKFNSTIGLATGTYFDEWTWVAIPGMGPLTQKYEFEIEAFRSATSVVTEGCNIPGANLAVGYWGRDPHKRIESEQVPQKILSLHIDKLRSRGKDVFLWQQVASTDPQALTCSCVKSTTDRADTTCASCYGVKSIPGYVKFAHETLYLASIDTGAILTDVILDTSVKPHRILLADTFTTGTFTSPAISYVNALDLNWDFRGDYANIKSTNTVVLEFSTDNVNYFPINEINDTGKKPLGSGNIYLRVTLTRASATDRSPEFEIFRVRHPKLETPYIKILRPAVIENPVWGTYGKTTEQSGERFWTVPLNYFDSSITADTVNSRIRENSFYERINGINTGIKYATSKPAYNEEFGIFTQQFFDARRTQPNEFYNFLVF